MATGGSFNTSVYTSSSKTKHYLIFDWERTSYSISNNTSTIKWSIIGYSSSGYVKAQNITLKIDGKVVFEHLKTQDGQINLTNGKVVSSGTLTLSHDSEGEKSFSAYLEGGLYVWAPNVSGSDSFTLDTIPRAARIVDAPNFTDEDNPRIRYSNTAGTKATKLEACISLDGSKDDIAYRDISKTGEYYTFNLTNAERQVLREAAKNSNSISVRFYVQTTIGDSVYRKSLTKTLTIVNAAPTLAPTALDTGNASVLLTGDANGTIIKGYNVLSVATNAVAKKEATIKSYSITCGGKTITTATGKFSYTESGTVKFTVTDSRGNTASKTLNLKLIDYVKLTCNLSIKPPNADGALSFAIKGNYFNGSFGAVSNSLAVQYRYKTNDGSYSEWVNVTPTISGNTYSANVNMTGLDYRSSYTFQARAQDAIYNGSSEPVVETVEKKVKTTPMFDWDDDSFAFHVPLFLDNTKQIWHKDTAGNNVLMMSLNASNQAFFGYGTYDGELGSTYFDGNSVFIRSKNNISNTASGTIGGNKAWTNSSDSRLKEDITAIPEVFSDIWLELQPKMFRWNEINKGDSSLHFGLIAQDVIDVFTKYDLDYRSYGFVATIPVDGVEYFALTYEYYNMLTAKVLKNTIEEIHDIKKELASIKAALAS